MSIEAKQQYLCDNVLEQGYEPEDFADYCEILCGSLDIDSWSMSQLQDIVKGFVASKNKTDQSLHQRSYAIHQQQDEKPQSYDLDQYASNSVVRQTYRQPPKLYGKSGSRVDNSQSSQGNNKPYKLQPNQKQELEEVFKDPFNSSFKKKQATSTIPDWPANTQTSPFNPNSLSNQFNFDFSTTVKIEKKHTNTYVNIGSSSLGSQTSTRPIELPYTKTVQKTVGNMSIFDISFDDIKDSTIVKKSSKNGGTLTSRDQRTVSRDAQPTVLIPMNLDLVGSTMTTSTKSKTTQRKKIKTEGVRIVQDDWSDRVVCVRAKKRQIGLKNDLPVTISGHEIVSRNLFMPDYVRYFVSTPGLNSEVKRKYNHCLKLRNNLQKFYPGFKLPYLQKTSWIKETDPQNISAHKTLISNFINDLLMNKELKNCRIVEEFLTLKDYKALKTNFQQYDKMARLKSIQELCLLSGQVQVSYTQAHRVYLEKLPQFVHGLEVVLERYKKLMEQFIHSHQVLQKTLAQLYQTTATMESLTKGFNASVQIGQQCYQLQATLKLIRKLYKEVDKQSKFQMNFFEFQVKPLVKYQKDNIGTIREQLQVKAKFQEAFNPNVKTEKKQSYNNVSLDQYKTKIEQPSKSLTVLKYQHGYYSNQAVSEASRMFSNLSQKLSGIFGSYCYQAEQRSMESAVFWGNTKKSMSLPMMA